jgi:drug/metabolite transporter (DMT)-like permease
MIVVPIDFLRLPLIATVGTAFYGEPLDWRIFLGAAVIFAGTYYSIRREASASGAEHRQRAAPQDRPAPGSRPSS